MELLVVLGIAIAVTMVKFLLMEILLWKSKRPRSQSQLM